MFLKEGIGLLEKKKTRAARLLKASESILACPKCHATLTMVEDRQLICQEGHTYNLSNKGTVYFPDKAIKNSYDKVMLTHRMKMIQAGLYAPLISSIQEVLATQEVRVLLDAGCGEGSFLAKLLPEQSEAAYFGCDLSKEGVELATQHQGDVSWLIADITRLPFQDHSISHILNIFSPSHYEEFQRVLHDEGQVIKVVPREDYLKELRALFFEDNVDKQTYQNAPVKAKFYDSLQVISDTAMTYSFSIPQALREDAVYMSPLHWSASETARERALKQLPETLTVSVDILIGKKHRKVNNFS